MLSYEGAQSRSLRSQLQTKALENIVPYLGESVRPRVKAVEYQ